VSTATQTPPAAPDRSPSDPTALAGFTDLLRSEATKLRTVRGWVVGLGTGAVVLVLFAILAANGSQVTCSPGPAAPGDATGTGGEGRTSAPDGSDCGPSAPLTAPGGAAIKDTFYFVHQTLPGNGSITVRVASLEGLEPAEADGPEPWAKAGLIIKAGTTPGSRYAAIMVTGQHGVHLQHDYTHDVAGSSGGVSSSSPRWLRLTRSGDRVTGYESADGTRWIEVGDVELAGLGSTAAVGMFVASPDHEETTLSFGGSATVGGPSLARAAFDDVALADGWSAGAWRGEVVGGPVDGPKGTPPGQQAEGFQESGGRFTVTGTGDIAPLVSGLIAGVERNLDGTFAALVGAIVVGTMFGTSEYRRRLVRMTFAATPRRGQVLAAKAVVLGVATFAVGLVGSVASIWLGYRMREGNGEYLLPVSQLTELRVAAGTAAMFALAAVLALAVGTMIRRSAAAVALGISLVVLPFLFSVAAVLPLAPAEWLLRLTPAAGFAVQQTLPEYDFVLANYTPPSGYYPLPPWAGLAVMCAWTVGALALATVVVRRRDA
jgi:hypothetical protein